MKIVVDQVRCEGHGVCEGVAPDLFRIDDEGDLVYQFAGRDVPTEHRKAAASSVSLCPVAALRIEG